MGLILGQYDAKPEGFVPGGASLHNCMSAHGPDADAHAAATQAELAPVRLGDTMAFMFETRWPVRLTRWAASGSLAQEDYHACWQGLASKFTGRR